MFFALTREQCISFPSVVLDRHHPVAQNRLFFPACLHRSREKRVVGAAVRLHLTCILPAICALTGRERLPSFRLPLHPVA